MMQWQKAKARQALMDAHRRKEDADPHTQADREVYRLSKPGRVDRVRDRVAPGALMRQAREKRQC